MGLGVAVNSPHSKFEGAVFEFLDPKLITFFPRNMSRDTLVSTMGLDVKGSIRSRNKNSFLFSASSSALIPSQHKDMVTFSV
jgi:hypothetical protein